MIAKLNSNLWHIVNVAMYGTWLEPDSFLYVDCLDDDLEEGYISYTGEFYWSNFDNTAYQEAIKELAEQYISEIIDDLKPYVTKIIVGEIYSPKFYNFSNDDIDLTVSYNKGKLFKYAEEHRADFETYLQDNYSSRDGFMSYTSNNYDAWFIGFDKNNEQEIGAILSYMIDNDINLDLPDFVDWCLDQERPSYSEFLTEDGYKMETEIEDMCQAIVDGNYRSGVSVEDMISKADKRIEELGWENDFIIEYNIKAKVKEIDDKTLKLAI